MTYQKRTLKVGRVLKRELGVSNTGEGSIEQSVLTKLEGILDHTIEIRIIVVKSHVLNRIRGNQDDKSIESIPIESIHSFSDTRR